MYGKFFQSTFTGSMVGAGADVFAVWGYVIAHADSGTVELNPILLKTIFGISEKRVQAAIEFLCSPDPASRSKEEEGRRMLKEGQFSYRVVNHETYRSIRNQDERREYNRLKKQEERAKSKTSTTVIDSQRKSVVSAHTEADTESEAEAEKKTGKSRAIALPPDFGLTEDRKAYALSKGVSNPQAAMEAFRAHHEAHGKTMKDWDAAWRTWCLNDLKFGGRNRAQAPKPPREFPR